MKKLLLILFLFSTGLSSTAYAGKNLNWCKTDSKINSAFYIDGAGKIKIEL